MRLAACDEHRPAACGPGSVACTARDRVALQSRAAGGHAGWSRTSSGVGRIYGGRLSSAAPLSWPQTACRVLPAGQRSATQCVEACQPAAAGHGSDAGAPRWRVRRRAGARASRSGRAGRPESPARCRAGACCPPWPALWRQAALAAGGPSASKMVVTVVFCILSCTGPPSRRVLRHRRTAPSCPPRWSSMSHQRSS